MKTAIVTAPAATPISLDDAKSHLIVDHDDDDIYITGLIAVATANIEDVTGLKLVSQTWNLYLGSWPVGDLIALPFGKCSAVTEIGYLDSADNAGIVAPGDYDLDGLIVPSVVVLADDTDWPDVELAKVNPIYVQFVTGDTVSDVPTPLKHAIKLLVGHWYANREEVIIGTIMTQLPRVVSSLIYPHRMIGF